MKLFASLAVTLMLFLAFTLPALAQTGPTRESFHREDAWMEAQCDGFQALLTESGDVRVTTFYDENGTAVRKTWHESGMDRIFNSQDPSKYIGGKYTFTQQIDLLTGEQTYTGTFWHFVAPGYGSFYFLSGRYILASNGEFTFGRGRQNFEQAALCAVLK